MENKVQLDQQIVEKVLRDLKSSIPITMKRFEMLKNIAKEQRPWNHEEVVKSWEEAIRQYNKTV